MKKAIAYYRVSTDSQGTSGLDLEAQANAVSQSAHQKAYHMFAIFTEIESNKETNDLSYSQL